MSEVAFVTTSDPAYVAHDYDRAAHDASFAARGVALSHCAWDDPAVDWAAYDLVVVRSPWDYSQRVEEFLGWLGSLDTTVKLHNPATLIRWNLDKRYLAELAAAGVPVIPTRYATTPDEVHAAVAATDAAEVVVKPAVSAGSRNTGRFACDDAGAVSLAQTILGEGGEVMVQPCAASVAERGEGAMVLFNGELSHAFRKGPILASGGGFLGGEYTEAVAPWTPSDAERDVARAAARAASAYSQGAPLLYGRFDIVTLDDGAPALLEAELFEPCFFIGRVDPRAADRFTDACLSRL